MELVRPWIPGARVFDSASKIKDAAIRETEKSNLPGYIDGPGDAFRHIVGAAEVVRQHGELIGRAILEANEIDGSYLRGAGSQSKDAAAMDRHNNEIGIRIGKNAKSIEEVVERAKAEIQSGIDNGGSGKDGGPMWLVPSQWKTIKGEPDKTHVPDNWNQPRAPEQTGDAEGAAEPRAARMASILAKPGRDWSDDDARFVMNDRRYWDSRRQDPALIERVNDSFHQRFDGPNGGPIQVDAYMRADGTQVAAHTRAEPQRRPGSPEPGSDRAPDVRLPYSTNDVPRAKPARGNRPPPRRKGRP